MTGWKNTPASDSLVAEFNAAFPGRDKASDGTIGDPAHAKGSSDHNPDETGKTPYKDSDSINEVHARDVDDDLNTPGWDMQRVLDIIVARCKSGQEKRLQNIIYNRRVVSRSWNWGSWQPYGGPSPHTEHAHFSLRYGSGVGPTNLENITVPWGFLAVLEQQEGLPVDPAEFNKLMSGWATSAAGKKALADAVVGNIWGASWGSPTGRETAGDRLAHVDQAVDDILTGLAEIAPPKPVEH